MTELHFANLAYPDVEDLLRTDEPTVLLLPLGATEPHGPHAPLGTDTLISLRMCELAAELLGEEPGLNAFVLPPLAYGVTRYGAAFAGAVSVSERTLHGLVVDVCGSLAAQGFSRLVLVNNHFEPEQVRTLRDATAAACRLHRSRIAFLDLTRRENAERLTEEFRAGSCHAGRYETSLVLAGEPALVRRDRMSGLPAKMVDMPAAIASGETDFLAMGMDRAYCGAPAEATAEEGRRTLTTLAHMLVDLVRDVAREDGS